MRICVQKKIFRIPSYKEPQMNKDIMERIIDKDKALKKAKSTKLPEDWSKAKELRNFVGCLVD